MSTAKVPQPDAVPFRPKRLLFRLALGVFLWSELHLALTRTGYDIRTRDLLKLVFLFSAVRMVAPALPGGGVRGLGAWIRTVLAVPLLVVGELALLIGISPLTWTPFALGIGSLTAAVLIARLRFTPERVTCPPAGST